MLMHEITACWWSEGDMIRSSDNGQMKFNLQLMYVPVNKVMRLSAYCMIWQHCGLALHVKGR